MSPPIVRYQTPDGVRHSFQAVPADLIEVEECDDCGWSYSLRLLTRVRVIEGAKLLCPSCLEELRMAEASW